MAILRLWHFIRDGWSSWGNGSFITSFVDMGSTGTFSQLPSRSSFFHPLAIATNHIIQTNYFSKHVFQSVFTLYATWSPVTLLTSFCPNCISWLRGECTCDDDKACFMNHSRASVWPSDQHSHDSKRASLGSYLLLHVMKSPNTSSRNPSSAMQTASFIICHQETPRHPANAAFSQLTHSCENLQTDDTFFASGFSLFRDQALRQHINPAPVQPYIDVPGLRERAQTRSGIAHPLAGWVVGGVHRPAWSLGCRMADVTQLMWEI